MTSIYSTPKLRNSQIRDQAQDVKEDKFKVASVGEFSYESVQSTQFLQESPQTSSFDTVQQQQRPLGQHNRHSSEAGKENVQVLRKTINLYSSTTQQQKEDIDINDLQALLERVQIRKGQYDEQPRQDGDIVNNEEFSGIIKQGKIKQSSTCRFIPLRRETNSLKKNEEYQMQMDEEPIINQQDNRKGHEYVDKTQLSMKDVYKIHVLGMDNQQDIQNDMQIFQSKNILKFDDSENTINKNYQLPLRVMDNDNPIINTYDRIMKQNSRNNDQDGQNIRKINKIPFKVLDAPSLQDDFYLNLIDWSSSNILAVALGQCVYLWSAQNNKVVKFCDFSTGDEMVCSLAWSPSGHQLSVGTSSGEVHLFDTNRMKRVCVLEGHQARVGSLAWSNNALCSGSKDKSIHLHDLRIQKVIGKLEGHKQEVCGLKWSPDEYQLASGGNDNKLFVWRLGSERPLAKFSQHQAAVKALAWSPHRHGLLASGGGTADRTIRFFNTQTTQQLDWIDTGSQVCNLLFSKNINELISTHGYSMNQIVCWKYPTLEKVATLTGHTSRVLFLAMSPDGETVVTGAGDETLRFWNIFPKKSEEDIPQRSPLVSKSVSLR